MPNLHAMIRSLRPEDLAILLARGRDQELDHSMLDAMDRAAGGPGEGRGYYVVRGSLHPLEERRYYLRDDVADVIFDRDIAAGGATNDKAAISS